MIFTECAVRGAWIIDLKKIEDERGFFARAWCGREAKEHGLESRMAQLNIGASRARGTLRGMHYQTAPWEEAKLVRCTRGSVYDVVLDLGPGSPTYKRWFGIELSADNHRMLYLPPGCAHGYQTLERDSEIYYQTSQFYHAEAARGVRFDDPAFGIQWPIEVTVISDADRSWPMLGECRTPETEAVHGNR